MSIINVIWIDENYENEENSLYLNDLRKNKNLLIKCFKKVEDGIKYIKKIKFEETNIVISGALYFEFINEFKNNLKSFNVIPKIIIFTESKINFIKYNNSYNNYKEYSFYNFGGIQIIYSDVKNFILNSNNNNISNTEKIEFSILNNNDISLKKSLKEEEGNLTFEYIDCKEKLLYPTLYQSLIGEIKLHQINIYTELLYNKYKNNNNINKLLNSIRNILDIPIELISKYYIRLFTAESDFYKNINKDLRENKKDNYLTYIKVLYEGIKTKSLLLASNNILYRGTILLNKEIEKIKEYLKNKKEELPGAIVFSKTFLSFSKVKRVAEDFLEIQVNNNEFNKILFILENDNNIDYSLSTHADIEYISYHPI